MINEVRLIGNVGAEPRMGNNVSRLSVATEDNWKDQSGQWQSKTEWHYIVAFGFVDQYIRKYVHKGQQVYIEGSMMYGEYEKDGVRIRTAEVKAKKVKILGRKENQEESITTSSHSMGDVPF